jgi:hypothetical protein
MSPIALSDSELGCVMVLAKNVPQVMRRRYLEAGNWWRRYVLAKQHEILVKRFPSVAHGLQMMEQ